MIKQKKKMKRKSVVKESVTYKEWETKEIRNRNKYFYLYKLYNVRWKNKNEQKFDKTKFIQFIRKRKQRIIFSYYIAY